MTQAVGCEGTGVVGTCAAVEGNVTAVTLSRFGAGYNASSLPTLSCEGGAGQTFLPVLPSGAEFRVQRTRSAFLRYTQP